MKMSLDKRFKEDLILFLLGNTLIKNKKKFLSFYLFKTFFTVLITLAICGIEFCSSVLA